MLIHSITYDSAEEFWIFGTDDTALGLLTVRPATLEEGFGNGLLFLGGILVDLLFCDEDFDLAILMKLVIEIKWKVRDGSPN